MAVALFRELGLVSAPPVGTKIHIFIHHTSFLDPQHECPGIAPVCRASLALKASPVPTREDYLPDQPPQSRGNSVGWLAMGKWSGFHGWWHASDANLVVSFSTDGNETGLKNSVFLANGDEPPTLQGWDEQGHHIMLTHVVIFEAVEGGHFEARPPVFVM